MDIHQIVSFEDIYLLPGNYIMERFNTLSQMIRDDVKFKKSTALWVSPDVSSALVLSGEVPFDVDNMDENPLFVGKLDHLKVYVDLDSTGIKFK